MPREVTWRAERLPALTNKVLNELLKAERRNCPAELKKTILRCQDYKCAMCGGIFDDDIEMDHLAPLQQSCKHQDTKWQALCASCHLEKTSLEGKQDRTLESTFSLPVYESYVKSPRPPPLVFFPHEWAEGELEALELDVRRCRRNALAVAAHPFSVFSPLDSIVPAKEGELGDFSFISLKAGRRSSVTLLPYYGPG